MVKLKESNSWNTEMLEALRHRVTDEILQKTVEVLKYQRTIDLSLKSLSLAKYEAWLTHYKDTYEVMAHNVYRLRLYQELFVKQSLGHIDYS